MKQFCIAIALLAGMLVLLGWNSCHMTNWILPLEDSLTESMEAVRQGDWSRGMELEAAVHRAWKENRMYLRLIQCHAGVNEINALLEQGELFLREQDALQYASVCTRAIGGMRELVELEHLSPDTLF